MKLVANIKVVEHFNEEDIESLKDLKKEVGALEQRVVREADWLAGLSTK